MTDVISQRKVLNKHFNNHVKKNGHTHFQTEVKVTCPIGVGAVFKKITDDNLVLISSHSRKDTEESQQVVRTVVGSCHEVLNGFNKTMPGIVDAANTRCRQMNVCVNAVDDVISKKFMGTIEAQEQDFALHICQCCS